MTTLCAGSMLLLGSSLSALSFTASGGPVVREVLPAERKMGSDSIYFVSFRASCRERT